MDDQERSEQYWRNFERMWPIGEEAEGSTAPIAMPEGVEPEPMIATAPVIKPEPVVESEPVIEPEPVIETEPMIESEPMIEPDAVIESEPDIEQASVIGHAPEIEPEPEQTFGQSRYIRRGEPVQYAIPAEAPKKKKKKKRISGVAVAVTALLCMLSALLGAFLGGSLVKRSIPAAEAPAQADPALESRIKALEEAARKAPRQQEYDAQEPFTTTQVYEQNVPSVVGIMNSKTVTNVFGQTSGIASAGSGFIIRADGHVVTNYHVVQGAESLRVSLYNGQEYDARLVGYDADYDVAVLKIEAEELREVAIGDSDLLRVGDQVAAIGNPLGELTLTMTVGYISARDREINTDGRPMNMLQTDVAINAGNSGGPLFDMKGNVIGITTAKYSGSTSSGASIEGIGFALPINDVMGIVNDLLELGYVTGRAYLGVTTMEMDARTAELYSLPMGVYVSSVTKGSCAETAGMKKGDIILKVGDMDTSSYSALKRALRAFNPGDQTVVTVYRAGSQLELPVTLDERPSDEEIAKAEEAEDEPNAEEQEPSEAEPRSPEPEQPEQSVPQTPDSGQSQGGFPFGGPDIEDWFRYFFGG